jgi:2-polyprenyl-3-methyl-5-hydroxy-6-metoxy-1,4-benzoquinol methylase
MSELSPKEHWDVVHVGEDASLRRSDLAGIAAEQQPWSRRVARGLKRMLGDGVMERMSAYDFYLLWNVILPQHLPSLRGSKVVEVGSAPGEFLVEFSQRHGCVPYGIEYSEVGVEVNRRVFSRNGFNPDNVIYSDFFSDEFQARYREQFDVVVSRGFIEHFEDVRPVVDRHINLLRPGGHLIIGIPNLRGVNYGLAKLFHKEVIPLHNIEIMRKQAFTNLFKRNDLEPLFCDHYGTFSFYLFTSGLSRLPQYALKTGQKVQPLLNLAFRTFLRDKGAESGILSPYLLYIGRKTGT